MRKLDRSVPKRLHEVLDELESFDMRVGQFFENIRLVGLDRGDSDLFYLENDKLLKLMEEQLARYKKHKSEDKKDEKE